MKYYIIIIINKKKTGFVKVIRIKIEIKEGINYINIFFLSRSLIRSYLNNLLLIIYK